jgi:hypothetical protein
LLESGLSELRRSYEGQWCWLNVDFVVESWEGRPWRELRRVQVFGTRAMNGSTISRWPVLFERRRRRTMDCLTEPPW